MLLNRLGPKYFHPFSRWIWPFPQDFFKFYDEPLCLDTSDFLGTSTLTFGGAILSNGENLEIAEMLNLTSKDCTLFKPIIIPQPFWLCTSSAKIKMRYALKVHFWMFSHFWMVRCFLLSHFWMSWCFLFSHHTPYKQLKLESTSTLLPDSQNLAIQQGEQVFIRK